MTMLLRATRRLTSTIPTIPRQQQRLAIPFGTAHVRPSSYHHQQLRMASTVRPTSTIRIPPVPLAMIGLGLVCLGIGLYDHFTSDIQKYPTRVRSPLRKALYYEQKDPTLALPYFQQAFEEALLPENELDLDGAPLTGILIQWGTLLERLGRLPDARKVLIMALRHVLGMENVPVVNSNNSNNSNNSDDDDTTTGTTIPLKAPDQAIFTMDWAGLPPIEQKKVVGLCLKLGDLNAALRRDEEAEKYYVTGVEHLLGTSKKPASNPYGDDASHDGATLFDKDHLPAWLTSNDVGIALATLGRFYASRKKYDYAIELYLRALLLRGLDSCESATFMNNLAESYVAVNAFSGAKIWLERGISLAQNPNTGKRNKDQQVCDEACGILLFNLGMVFEQMQDKEKAIQMYQQSIQHGRQHEQMACVQEALKAKKRVEYEVAREQQANVA